MEHISQMEQLFSIEKMIEKHSWHRTHLNLISNSQPAPRWGHSCCAVGHEIVFFGGYAQSIYMNDVWSFNTATMQWTEIKTTGDIPSNRSNCAMTYDSKNDQIIVFGGGGPNKLRFNSINVLNWNTKQWVQIQTHENQSAPWERTYHAAQLFYPYLVVYGGEGVADMDDLWVFNFSTLAWKQIQINNTQVKPCARRFHSSAKIGNQFFIIGGCRGKYRSLSDIYSLDLTPLLENESVQQLVWKDRKPQGSAFLTRWGHTSTVYDKKIYIFGGRFSNDLNDVLIFDPSNNTIKTLKTTNQLPKARRRHSACFIGSCMVIFGGFNGEYYNDLNYINVFELKSRIQTPPSCKSKSATQMVGNKTGSDAVVISSQGRKIFIHKSLLSKGFRNDHEMLNSIQKMNDEDQKILLDILEKIYIGYGQIDQKTRQKYQIDLPQTQEAYEEQLIEQICPNLSPKPFSRQRIGKKSAMKIPVTICLSDDQFTEFLQESREKVRKDIVLVINNTFVLPSNSAMLSLSSKFFNNILSNNYKQYKPLQGQLREIHLTLPEIVTIKEGLKSSNSMKNLQDNLNYTPNIVLFEILLNYLLYDKVIVPNEMSAISWLQLYILAEYFCLGRLMSICEKQLCLIVDEQNCEQIFQYAIMTQIEVLALYCSDYLIKIMINRGYQIFPDQQQELNQKDKQSSIKKIRKKKEQILKYMYSLALFDIQQVRLERTRIINEEIKRKQFQIAQEEKQNYQINENY